MEEGKQLDFNAPFLSVRRFAAAPPPPTPLYSSSSSANSTTAAAASSRAEVGGRGVAGERSRKFPLPFYRSDLKSGPVRNPGAVPFLWEKSPGRPKDGSFPDDSPATARPTQPPSLAPKPPPWRIPRRYPDEKDEPKMSKDASSPPSNSPYLRSSSPLSSPTSVHPTVATTTAATFTASPSTASSSKTLQSAREERKGGAGTLPVVEPAAEAAIFTEHGSVKDNEDEEEDVFSDALDALSRTESSFMNCSVSGITGGTEAWEHSGRFPADPQVRDFMMGRFLPAAQAMATESPVCPTRKAPPPRGVLWNGGELRRPAASMPPVQRSSLVSTYPRGITSQLHVGNGPNGEDSGSGDDDEDAGRLRMKGCGLLSRFCLRGSFGLLNPIPGMKTRCRMPLPGAPRRSSSQLRISRHGSDGDDEHHSWEDVYKYECQAMGEEEGGRITSESNRLSYWTDSQTLDGSSPCRLSNGGRVSPYRNDVAPSFPFHEGRGFLGVPKSENRDGDRRCAAFEHCAEDDGEYWEASPHPSSSKEESGSVSPVVERTVYVDTVQVLDNSDPQLCSSDTEGMVSCHANDSDTRIETSPLLGACENSVLLNKMSEVSDAEGLSLLGAERLGTSMDRSGAPHWGGNNTVDTRQGDVLDGAQVLRAEHQGKYDSDHSQPLPPPPPPPPLPTSPTESWLWRTLPSISSKHAGPQTFLGLQLHHKRQVTQATPTHPKWEAMVKTPVLKKGQVRFADALVKPANVD